ncbi:uncharacterized protein LOC111872525 isoform X2 [Cryptotermes secundus]|uniref:uncharacterized protein LOC111872525 isoform X2 n=1 Tax=Cryptotermes secundus TaxID=105785 RepID=UPI000CD7C62E|nr:uncharacterized protein LOC111872525 isoform X2 [Cryptotermes secundus]
MQACSVQERLPERIMNVGLTSEYSFPHFRHAVPNFRRQLSHHEQKEILTDIQQNHRFQQALVDPRAPTNSHQHPFSILQQQQYSHQQERHLIPQQPTLNPTQQSAYSTVPQLTREPSSSLFPQPQSPVATQESPILLSLQQSPLSSPQFSSLFSQQPQVPFATQNSPLSTQPSPVLLSLQNSPLSIHRPTELFSLVPQTPHSTQQSPLTSQQSPDTFSQQPKSPISTQQSTLTTQESENERKEEVTTQQQKTEDQDTDTKILNEDTNTDFTIQRSISDPEELQKVQRLELQREQERKERLKKFQEEQLKLIQEQSERRLKERQEEDKRDEERRLKLQEQLRKIQEEKEKRRKQQEEEQLRLMQERKERLLKLQQEVKLRLIQEKERQKKEEEEEQLRTIEEQKDKEEKQQQEPSLSSVIYAQPTPATKQTLQEIVLQPSQNEQRPRQRARIVEESDPSVASEQLFLQNERQKLYYQLKEAQQQQERKQQASDQKQQIQEPLQGTINNKRPANQVTQPRPDQRSAHQSKLSELEKQLHQKQLQDQLQKQFQLQLLQRQDLLRQLKLAVSKAATPTNEDQIAPGPIAVSGGNTSAQLFLANGQKIQVVQSPRQGRPLTDTVPGNESPPTASVSTTTQRPPRALFEELTKGVLPPGADFEVIRHKQDGALEDVGKQLPQNLPQKKVTFVFLEEQEDGSYKVKGVRGSHMGQPEGDQTPASDIESIIKKLQEGDLKLPAPSNIPVAQQSTVPQLPSSISSPKVSENFITQSTVNPIPTTSKPNSIIKTVSSNFNIQSRPTTAKPNSIIKTVSSNFNIQHHRGMDFLQSVTLPPLYDVDSTVNSKANKQTIQTDFSTTQLNSPYSVDAHPTGQNAAAPVYPQTVASPHPQQGPGSINPYTKINQQPSIYSSNVDDNTPQYKKKNSPVTTYPTITQFSPTVAATAYFPQNEYSPSIVPQYTTLAPKKKLLSKEPFLPTDPSFVNPSQSYASFFASGNIPKQTFQGQETSTPGIIYANPTTQVPLLTTNTSVQQVVSKQKQRDFHQNIDAPSLKTRTRVAAPSSQNILKESERLVPLEEDGSVEYQTTVGEVPLSLADVLKKEGLYAMARFLRESGLNNMLNDTGPYTVFAPTDKAFRALLVQLGGPEKAEEKFKENPRLLSGLLLHHVIPGAFELSSLQDEMTGVSLAGTQLRVNTYTTQDVEWNDVKVVTINGARISRDKHDVPIPQGIAHAVDRVMFPLPVGNIIQTLRSDRERRFTKFLRAIQVSGLTDNFTGNKVYTVFAPTDRAFSVVDTEDLNKLLTDGDMSRALVLRHAIPGTLYSSGMRFYQLRDSLEKGSSIALHKSNGQVKANSAGVATHNIPATNGVIHAIDGLL